MNSSILSTDHYPFLYTRHVSPFPSPFRYPAQVRFEPSRIRARLVQYGSAKQSFYEVLGVPKSGSLIEIKQAYKRLARKYHPDVSPPDQADEYTVRFVRVREAYETLSDPHLRDLYDREMSKGFSFEFHGTYRWQYDKEFMEEKSEWNSRWQVQLLRLRRRYTIANNNNNNNLSWAAKMRRQSH